MKTPVAHGRHCPALLTDLYQLTMAYGYWKTGAQAKEAVFHLFFRTQPFKGGFSVACGLHDALESLRTLEFLDEELAYLATLTGNDEQPLFEPAFLDYLRKLEWSCDMDGVPEGMMVFPHEPMLWIQGPLIQCQLVETALLNLLNFQTLIATKAARVCLAARSEPVLEFGLRRAQGTDGGIAASRAAFIGGCAATSNVLAARLRIAADRGDSRACAGAAQRLPREPQTIPQSARVPRRSFAGAARLADAADSRGARGRERCGSGRAAVKLPAVAAEAGPVPLRKRDAAAGLVLCKPKARVESGAGTRRTPWVLCVFAPLREIGRG